MSYKGKYKPQNPKKYKGDPSNIIYRSMWERKVMKYLDTHSEVVWWASEEIFIPYYSIFDKKMHRYFPDFVAQFNTVDGEKVYMIEVKPFKKLSEPVKKSRVSRRFVREMIEYKTNMAKFEAARAFCEKHGWEFQIITEKELKIRY